MVLQFLPDSLSVKLRILVADTTSPLYSSSETEVENGHSIDLSTTVLRKCARQQSATMLLEARPSFSTDSSLKVT